MGPPQDQRAGDDQEERDGDDVEVAGPPLVVRGPVGARDQQERDTGAERQVGRAVVGVPATSRSTARLSGVKAPEPSR